MNVKLTCDQCGSEFLREKKQLCKTDRKHVFCSDPCFYLFYNRSITQPCAECGAPVTRLAKEVRRSKSGRLFCDTSCAASYNNRQKRKSRRSKCEIRLFNLLKKSYPDLQLLASDKTMLDGMEVDIAIPSLQLAIEWNGIVHYQPIYGDTKLSKVRQRDEEKRQTAERKHVRLIVIPDLVSTESRVQDAFQEIREIIDQLRVQGSNPRHPS